MLRNSMYIIIVRIVCVCVCVVHIYMRECACTRDHFEYTR